jgi:hypothetical protein
MERQRALQKEADILAAQANKATKAKAHVAGNGRAIGLRTYYSAIVTNYGALLKYAKERRSDDLKAWLDSFAQSEVKAGARSIPGVDVIEEKRVA